MKTIVFAYRMTADSGLAPCIDNDTNDKKILTLACCKGGRRDGTNTGIRYWIGKGKLRDIDLDCKNNNIYILGTYKNDFLYLAKINETMTMQEYYSCKAFSQRTDKIYDVVDGKLKRNNKLRKQNIHIDKEQQTRDIAGKYVLLSHNFIYLGKDRKPLDHFKHKLPVRQEIKMYFDEEAQEIVNWCKQQNDGKSHIPTDPLKRSCNQK